MTKMYTLSLHAALPISVAALDLHHLSDPGASVGFGQHLQGVLEVAGGGPARQQRRQGRGRSEEHTSELQSRGHLVCRLLLEKKKQQHTYRQYTEWKHAE